ncbi:MAG TPA: hypothetical protein VIY73_10715, partial [Polyangiaceae bacterium]
MSGFSDDEVRVLKRFAGMLLGASSGTAPTNGNGGGTAATDTFSEDKLGAEWADKVITKDP